MFYLTIYTTAFDKPPFYLAQAAEFDHGNDLAQFFVKGDVFDHLETLPFLTQLTYL